MTGTQDKFEIITKGEMHELRQLVGAEPILAVARDANGVSALMTAAYYRKQDMVGCLRDLVSELDIFEAAALGDDNRLRQLQNRH